MEKELRELRNTIEMNEKISLALKQKVEKQKEHI